MSLYEADPLTIKECMLFNKPMVLSNIDSFNRICSTFKGICICDYDRREVADSILKMAEKDIGLNQNDPNIEPQKCLRKLLIK